MKNVWKIFCIVSVKNLYQPEYKRYKTISPKLESPKSV